MVGKKECVEKNCCVSAIYLYVQFSHLDIVIIWTKLYVVHTTFLMLPRKLICTYSTCFLQFHSNYLLLEHKIYSTIAIAEDSTILNLAGIISKSVLWLYVIHMTFLMLPRKLICTYGTCFLQFHSNYLLLEHKIYSTIAEDSTILNLA